MRIEQPTITGYFTLTPFFNNQSETTQISEAHFFNLASGTSNAPVYGAIWDGSNHFDFQSAFTGQTYPQDVFVSFNENSCDECSVTTEGAYGIPLWIGGTARLRFTNLYAAYSYSGGTTGGEPEPAVVLYFGGNGTLTNDFLVLDGHFEDDGGKHNLTNIVQFQSGAPSTTVTLAGLEMRDNYSEQSGSLFSLGTNVSAVNLEGADIEMGQLSQPGASWWDTPSAYKLTGTVVDKDNSFTMPTGGGSVFYSTGSTVTQLGSMAYTNLSGTSLNATSIQTSSIQTGSLSNSGSISSVSVSNANYSKPGWSSYKLQGNLPTYTFTGTGGGSGGSAALTSITSGSFVNSSLLTGGVGCSTGDTLYITDPQSGGGPYGGGQVYLTISASGGAFSSVTAVTAVGGSSNNPYWWSKPWSASTTVSARSSTCSVLPTLTQLNGYSNQTWYEANSPGSLLSTVSLTSGGEGYSGTVTAVPATAYNQNTSEPSAVIASVNAQTTISAGNGVELLSATGTQLEYNSTPLLQALATGAYLGSSGSSGLPTLSLGALIDNSGVRTTLTTSGYTVPVNTSLVRFAQTSTVSSATITLPTALADGQSIQFINESSNPVTALTFSPSVIGWTNGSALAPNVSMQVSWDATASAWYVEGNLTSNGYFPGSVGIGTSTPGSLLSLSGIANFTTATSTFYSTGGISLTTGCYALNGNCLTLGSFSGTLAVNQGGTGSTTLSGILKGNGTGSILSAVAGVDYQAPITAGTGLSFSGNTLNNYWTLNGSNNLYNNNSGTEIGINNSSPSYSLDVGGFINTGASYGFKQAGNTILLASSTNDITAVGQSALTNYFNTTANVGETALGYQALQNATSSGFDTAVGYQALKGNGTISSSGSNTGVGYAALTANSSGAANIGVGRFALGSNTTGSNNIGIGAFAMNSNQSGGANVAIGRNALFYDTTAGSSVAIGYQAGEGPTTVSNYNTVTDNDMTFVGFEASRSSSVASTTSLTNGTAIGYLASVGCSNCLVLGGTGSNSVDVGIGTTTPYASLSVWGPDSASSTPAFDVINNASTSEFTVFDGGNAELAGNLSQNSDQRLKTNVQSLDASSSLSLIDQLNPVTFNWIDPNRGTALQLGFIAQQVEQVFPTLVSTTAPTALTPDGTLSLNYIDLISPIVAAIQELSQQIASIENTIAGFAQSFTTHQLCVDKSDGSPVCVNGDQLAALLASENQPSAISNSPVSSSGSTSAATATPPVIQINGDNPAIVQVGASYSDLGATITGPQADLDLGIQTYLNGILESPILIDTTAPATDTIDYVATDQNGLTSTSTRTVIVEPPSLTLSTSTSDASSTTATSSSSD